MAALRLSPHSGDFTKVCNLFRDRLAGRLSADALSRRLLPEAPGGRFSDGFLSGAAGVAWSGPAA